MPRQPGLDGLRLAMFDLFFVHLFLAVFYDLETLDCGFSLSLKTLPEGKHLERVSSEEHLKVKYNIHLLVEIFELVADGSLMSSIPQLLSVLRTWLSDSTTTGLCTSALHEIIGP